jgi:hypothetical protein
MSEINLLLAQKFYKVNLMPREPIQLLRDKNGTGGWREKRQPNFKTEIFYQSTVVRCHFYRKIERGNRWPAHMWFGYTKIGKMATLKNWSSNWHTTAYFQDLQFVNKSPKIL